MKYIKLFEEFEEFDPFGEEIKEIGNENIIGYFVADSYRELLTIPYVKEFLRKYQHRIRIHPTYQEALIELRHGFYDDSDYQVVALFKNGDVSLLGRGNQPNE